MDLITIIANEGMVLTNGESYVKKIYLGINDNPNNWYEITIEEYQNLIE